MNFLSLIASTLRWGTASVSVMMFLLSTLLLAAGLAMKVRSRLRLHFLEYTPLNSIEYTHPHLPSPKAVALLVICYLTLLLVSLQTIQGAFPFQDPYQGLNLVTLFLVGGALSILAELKWKGATEYASGLLTGTALAFLLILQMSAPERSLPQEIVLLTLLLPSLLLVGFSFTRRRNTGVLASIIVAFGFWMLVFFGTKM